jgi:lysine 2,3-aminomutase
MPNYIISQTPNKVIMRNFEGLITTYTEPDNYDGNCNCEYCRANRSRKAKSIGVMALSQGERLSIEPKGIKRLERNK